jgi:hypothetical protein
MKTSEEYILHSPQSHVSLFSSRSSSSSSSDVMPLFTFSRTLWQISRLLEELPSASWTASARTSGGGSRSPPCSPLRLSDPDLLVPRSVRHTALLDGKDFDRGAQLHRQQSQLLHLLGHRPCAGATMRGDL